MNEIRIEGQVPLKGEVEIQGSKNAALPIMAASLLIPGITVLKNCPHISDVDCMLAILEKIGCRTAWEGKNIVIDASEISENRLPDEYTARMRSSVMLMGPMLGRCREISLGYPGGCVIGDRPIDIHLNSLKKFGVSYVEEDRGLRAFCPKLSGCLVTLPFPSVGATENLLMAAVTAEGNSEIRNAAREPEITALCRFLKAAGAGIEGEGTSEIAVKGVKQLHETQFEIEADRIVAGTYLFAGMAAGGDIFLRKAPWEQLGAVLETAGKMGCAIQKEQDGIRVCSKGKLQSPGKVVTAVYPGYPTDLQSPLLAVLCMAEGVSVVEERIFNGRFRIVKALNRMGAGIHPEKTQAWVPGGKCLRAQAVEAEELRGGAALVVAGLGAEGITKVGNRHFIERGYEDICRDMRALGARIEAWNG